MTVKALVAYSAPIKIIKSLLRTAQELRAAASLDREA